MFWQLAWVYPKQILMLHSSFLQDSNYQNKRFNNNTKDFKALQKWLKPIKQTQVFIYIIKLSNIKNNILLGVSPYFFYHPKTSDNFLKFLI